MGGGGGGGHVFEDSRDGGLPGSRFAESAG